MGNLSAALNSPVHDDVLLAEYRACDLRRLTESEVIWREDLRGRKFLSSACFEVVFGHVFGDCSVHFRQIFRCSMTTRVHTKMDIGDLQRTRMSVDVAGTCAAMDVFAASAILARGSTHERLCFIFALFAHPGSCVNKESFLDMLTHVSTGLHRLIGTPIPARDKLAAYASGLFGGGNRDEKQLWGAVKHRDTLNFKEFYDWCSDFSDVASFLDAVLALGNCLPPREKLEGGDLLENDAHHRHHPHHHQRSDGGHGGGSSATTTKASGKGDGGSSGDAHNFQSRGRSKISTKIFLRDEFRSALMMDRNSDDEDSGAFYRLSGVRPPLFKRTIAQDLVNSEWFEQQPKLFTCDHCLVALKLLAMQNNTSAPAGCIGSTALPAFFQSPPLPPPTAPGERRQSFQQELNAVASMGAFAGMVDFRAVAHFLVECWERHGGTPHMMLAFALGTVMDILAAWVERKPAMATTATTPGDGRHHHHPTRGGGHSSSSRHHHHSHPAANPETTAESPNAARPGAPSDRATMDWDVVKKAADKLKASPEAWVFVAVDAVASGTPALVCTRPQKDSNEGEDDDGLIASSSSPPRNLLRRNNDDDFGVLGIVTSVSMMRFAVANWDLFDQILTTLPFCALPLRIIDIALRRPVRLRVSAHTSIFEILRTLVYRRIDSVQVVSDDDGQHICIADCASILRFIVTSWPLSHDQLRQRRLRKFKMAAVASVAFGSRRRRRAVISRGADNNTFDVSAALAGRISPGGSRAPGETRTVQDPVDGAEMLKSAKMAAGAETKTKQEDDVDSGGVDGKRGGGNGVREHASSRSYEAIDRHDADALRKETERRPTEPPCPRRLTPDHIEKDVRLRLPGWHLLETPIVSVAETLQKTSRIVTVTDGDTIALAVAKMRSHECDTAFVVSRDSRAMHVVGVVSATNVMRLLLTEQERREQLTEDAALAEREKKMKKKRREQSMLNSNSGKRRTAMAASRRTGNGGEGR